MCVVAKDFAIFEVEHIRRSFLHFGVQVMMGTNFNSSVATLMTPFI